MSQSVEGHEHSHLPCIIIKEGQDEKVIYSLPPTPGPENSSVLYFSVPKAGTVLLTNLMSSLAHAAKLTLVYVIGELYQVGILPDEAPASTSQVILPKGYCYGFPGVTVQGSGRLGANFVPAEPLTAA